MNFNLKKPLIIYVLVVLVVFCFFMSASAEETMNTGLGKPKALDIYIEENPYSASIGGNVSSGTKEEVPNEFKVVVDDKKIDEPEYFPELGGSPDPTESDPTEPEVTPTPTPLPTATTEIPVNLSTGQGLELCVLDDKSEIIVEFAFSKAGYKNEFKLSSPRSTVLGWTQGENLATRQGTAFGTVVNLGTFEVGQKLVFADTANGYTFFTGPKSNNKRVDNKVHAVISLANQTGTHHKYLVSFEDMRNQEGPDWDFDDVEFWVSGNLSTDCSSVTSSETDSLIPTALTACKCTNTNSEDEFKNKDVCVALFTYTSTMDGWKIPVRETSLPWNEFTGSGMVNQYRCQPTTFYIDSSRNSPFWTNRFWNNIKWKLGYEKSALIKCDQDTPTCESLGYKSKDICKDCVK